jgi:hypothetical protein
MMATGVAQLRKELSEKAFVTGACLCDADAVAMLSCE